MNATLQIILTYSLVTLVSAYAVYKIFRTLWPGKQEAAGCGSNCGCDSAKVKKDILELKQKKLAN